MHDRTGLGGPIEQEIALNAFPTPAQMWHRYCQWKGIPTRAVSQVVEMPYHDDGTGRSPRYYQASAVNNTVEAVAKEQQRIL